MEPLWASVPGAVPAGRERDWEVLSRHTEGRRTRRKMCIVTTIPMPLRVFMAPHIQELSKHFDISLVSNGVASDISELLGPRVKFVCVGIQRKISLLKDLFVLVALWRFFRHRRFDVVHSMTPKSGLLAMLAAALTGVPVRVHCFTGQVWATRRGFSRWFLKNLDWLLAACATHLLADSPSQRDFLIRERVARSDQISVLGHGSVCGVDTVRFRSDPIRRADIRKHLNIPGVGVVALYVGRLNRDKGLSELAAAFRSAASRNSNLFLLIVGPDEEGMKAQVIRTVGEAAARVRFVGFTTEPEAYMAAADFFVLPSYREGFGSTVIEAAACGIPSIGSRVYGLTDAIIEGKTGLLVSAGDVAALTDAMTRLAEDGTWRVKLGERARRRVENDFATEILVDAMSRYYENILTRSG